LSVYQYVPLPNYGYLVVFFHFCWQFYFYYFDLSKNVNVPVIISEPICAFALLDGSYKEEALAADTMTAADQERLAQAVQPLQGSVTRKNMTIVGWSPNLLKNSSGEVSYLHGQQTSKMFHRSLYLL